MHFFYLLFFLKLIKLKIKKKNHFFLDTSDDLALLKGINLILLTERMLCLLDIFPTNLASSMQIKNLTDNNSIVPSIPNTEIDFLS